MENGKRNPAAGHSDGVRKSVLLASANASENRPLPQHLQALFVSRRFAVPAAIAALIASLAFGDGGRT
jgi:hypothetical protein